MSDPAATPPGTPRAREKRPACLEPGQRPAHESELGFKPLPMVPWFNPDQLIESAIRSILAGVFGTYADKRELQAALAGGAGGRDEREPWPDPGPQDLRDASTLPGAGPLVDYDCGTAGEVWVDYVADVGDGFGPTYTIAWLLAQKALPIPRSGRTATGAPGVPVHDGSAPAAALPADGGLPRGQILVMGGDQVYPTPSQAAYRDRMSGPYDAALPCLPNEAEECPTLFAIPGNHDWYDGLTAFIRQFCQGRMIGAWKTRQRRSYWAARLPHGWWLWGTDIQLGADIDKPQLDFFDAVAKMALKDGEGGRVILCTAKPSWVEVGARQARTRKPSAKRGMRVEGIPQGTDDDSAFGNLAYFERRIIRENGLVLAATLTGDAHHYTRYSADGDGGESVHKITAGGGGAAGSPTHHLPETIGLEMRSAQDGGETERVTLKRRGTFPTPDESRKLLDGLRLLGKKNPGMAVLLGAAYAVFSGALHLAVSGWPLEAPLLRALTGTFGTVALLAAGLLMVIAFILTSLSHDAESGARSSAALGHGATHIAVAAAGTAVLAGLNLWLLPRYTDFPAWAHALFAAVSVALVYLLGRRVGPRVMGSYLKRADRKEINSDEAFAAQALEDFKNFLRMRVTVDSLTIWPIGVRQTVRMEDWVPDPDGGVGSPHLRPTKPLSIELIEEPIHISRDVRLPY